MTIKQKNRSKKKKGKMNKKKKKIHQFVYFLNAKNHILL